MLQHKRAFAFPLNHLKLYMRFSNDRNFHTSYCSFLRRIASSREHSENRQIPEQSLASNFEIKPVTDPFNNFYGIESDEGVIQVSANPSSSKSVQESLIDKFVSKNFPEKFKNTCFGKVRLDTENNLIMHGQYEESTSLSITNEASKAFRLREYQIKNNESNDGTYVDQISTNVESQNNNLNFNNAVDFSDVRNQTDSQKRTFEIDHIKEQISELSNDASFIDESFFPDKLLKNEQDIIGSQVSNESASNIDKSFFNEVIKENVDVTLNKNSEHETLKYTEVVGSEKKLSYIDESFFGSELSNEREKISKINPEPTVHNSKTSYNNEEMSFIDECFFNVSQENKHRNKDTIGSEKSLSSLDTNFKNNVTEDDRSHKTKISQSKSDLKEKECNKEVFQNYCMDTNISNNMTIKPENSYFNPHEPNQFTESNSPSSFNSRHTNNFSYNEKVKEQLGQAFNTKSMENQKLNDGLSSIENSRLPIQSKPTPVLNESNKLHSSKNITDQKQDQDEQPETAFDFVKKLRGEKSTTYHERISGFSKAPKEKIDSKGFRILKYQVPELKYFTRDEMLELLVQNVLYSDDDVVVLNKPYNLVMHESQTTKDACLSSYLSDLAGELDKKMTKPQLLTVHRLDKETTGCLLLARNEISAQRLKNLFAQRKIVKTYWIVTIKVPDPLQGIIDIPIAEGLIDNRQRMVLNPDLPKDIPYKNHSKRGKNAVTHYKVVAESGNAALVEVKPETGIKHQIRVHFGLGLSCPILGDHKYTYQDKFVPQKLPTDMLNRLSVRQSKVRYIPMHIYARSIFIPQYTEGRNLFVMAPMPAHISKNLQSLKFKKK